MLFVARRHAWCIIAASFFPLLASCGARSAAVLPVGSHGSSGTSAALRIVIPKATGTSSKTRSPRYVSPATQSMTVVVTQHSGGAPVLNETVGLTPTSTGCSSTLTSTICTLNLPLGPGTYDMTLSTYDGYDSAHGTATGTELSAGQDIDFTIVAGQANTISVTLSGIPASLAVFSIASGVHGSQVDGFTVYGFATQKLMVEALDPDGDVIIGPGSPAFTIASSSGSAFTIANPATATPNTFALTAAGAGGSETFTVTAAYGDSTCSTAGAVCTVSFSATSSLATVFVANYGANDVTVYAPPYGAPTATVSNSLTSPVAVTTDASGDLFVGTNASASIYVFAPPYTGTPTAAGPNGVYAVSDVLVSPSGTLFADGGPNVIEVAPPYTGSPDLVTQSAAGAKGMALDASGDLFVPNQNDSSVDVFAPPYTGTPTVITNGIDSPQSTVVDSTGDLFVANSDTTSTVTEYASPYTGAPVATVTNGVSSPVGLAMDASRNLFVANGSGSVTVYAPPYTGTPTTITHGISSPQAIAVDLGGDLFVQNGNSTVTVYTPPYTAAPVATISSGISAGAGWEFGLALYQH